MEEFRVHQLNDLLITTSDSDIKAKDLVFVSISEVSVNAIEYVSDVYENNIQFGSPLNYVDKTYCRKIINLISLTK